MKPNFIWNVEDVDSETKKYFETQITERVLTKLLVPNEYENQNLNITIHKNPDEPTMSFFIAGKILSENETFVAEYKLQSSPKSEAGVGLDFLSYKDTLQF
ncbi:MAG: hypothetical protein HGB12_12855 [Bacteroidetes bacterium]|nr:hypothetical protein [Bacteroidota bacterium]